MSQAKIQIFFGTLLCIFILNQDCSAQKKRKKTRRGTNETEYLNAKNVFFGGLNFGLSLSQVDGDNFGGYNKADINFSAIGFTKVSENVAISTEVGYNTKGSKAGSKETPFQNSNGEVIQDFLIKLAYADISVLANIFDKKQNNFGIGISYGRLIQSEEFIDKALIETEYPFEKNAFDVVLNGNFRIIKSQPLFFNLRFQYSILPIRKNYAGLYGRDEQISKQILMRVSYIF